MEELPSLTPQEIKFCGLYLSGMNAKESYKRSFNNSYPQQAASRLLKREHIKGFISEHMRAESDKIALKREDILNTLHLQIMAWNKTAHDALEAGGLMTPEQAVTVKEGREAAKLASKMCGWDAPVEHVHHHNDLTEEQLKEGLERVGFGRRTNQLESKEV